MPEKYDLEAMLKEIEQDEADSTGANQKLSQEDIKKLLARKMADKKGNAK